jgi:tripartite-type tricarboxylate transporter receptor subunit TctC
MNHPRSRARRQLLLSLAATGLGAALPLHAQTAWPTKPVRIVVPFAPGGTTDILARVLAPELSKVFGQSFVVDNKAGAGGNIGAEIVAKSPGDGYTLLMGTVGTHGINKSLYSKLPYDPQKDFAPITLVAGVPNVMVMNAKRAQALGIASVPDFVRYAKGHPGQLNMASSGNGTSIHLAGELFKSRNSIFMTHIPFRGSGPALNDLLGGAVDVMFDNLPSAMPHIQSGALKAFAVTSLVRSAALPEVPTVAEAGNLPGFEASSWFGLLAPAGTPADVVGRLQQETAKALALPAVKERLLAQGAIPSGNTPAEFTRQIEAEIGKWAAVVKASGAKVD